jgi:hypothetical protein
MSWRPNPVRLSVQLPENPPLHPLPRRTWIFEPVRARQLGDTVRRPADVTLRTAALDRHRTTFGRAPELATADRGFSSTSNEQARRIAGWARSRPLVAHTNANVGSGGANGGASARKAGSVCSSAAMDWTAVATMANRACTAGSAWMSSRITWSRLRPSPGTGTLHRQAGDMKRSDTQLVARPGQDSMSNGHFFTGK